MRCAMAIRRLSVSEYTTLLLWMSLTVGRAGASAVMLRVGERTVQRWGLALAAVFTAALAMAHSAVTIAGFAVLLGLSLAPFFPATWALLMAERPTARQAGIVLAVSGLGAAALPWLMGVVSTRTGSLQVALALPFAAAVGLLVMSWFAPKSSLLRRTDFSSGRERITEIWMVWSCCRWRLSRRWSGARLW